MMGKTRLDLDAELRKILAEQYGDNKVYIYFQPPSGDRLKYPCITYYRNSTEDDKADNRRYLSHTRYTINWIGETPSGPLIDKILDTFQFCTHDNTYVSNGLNHDVFTIYY